MPTVARDTHAGWTRTHWAGGWDNNKRADSTAHHGVLLRPPHQTGKSLPQKARTTPEYGARFHARMRVLPRIRSGSHAPRLSTRRTPIATVCSHGGHPTGFAAGATRSTRRARRAYRRPSPRCPRSLPLSCRPRGSHVSFGRPLRRHPPDPPRSSRIFGRRFGRLTIFLRQAEKGALWGWS